MNNLNVSLVLKGIAGLLKIKGANRYKIEAYQTASRKIRNHNCDVGNLLAEGKLDSIPGIGAGLAEKIAEIINTGSCAYYQELISEYPVGLTNIIKVSGIGPSKTRSLYNKLGIKSLEELESKAQAGELVKLSGIGAKTEKKILDNTQRILQNIAKINLATATEVATKLEYLLLELDIVTDFRSVGSLRRKNELIENLSFVVQTTDLAELTFQLNQLPIVIDLNKPNQNKIITTTKLGIDMVFYIASENNFIEQVFYLTNTEEYNQKLKEIINLDKLEGAFKQESEIFTSLNLPYIIPELRDDLDSLDAAGEDQLPVSVCQEDIKGDLHMHSTWSDGLLSIEEMALACQDKGYEYLAICDHTQSLTVANGLTPKELEEQIKKIQVLNEKLDITILAGAEVDILADRLDYDDYLLKKLDVVVASIHSNFSDSLEKMMSRIFTALENPFVDILAHPTGRLVEGRSAYNIEFEKIVNKAIKTNTVLEINAAPKRLDLNNDHIKVAKRLGAKFIINTDAHHSRQLENMKYGVSMARKGWLEKEDLINTLSLASLKEILGER
ncbi:MAG: DNA polymerase/3'-5' exonuclease PolX [Bacillota bacterium]